MALMFLCFVGAVGVVVWDYLHEGRRGAALSLPPDTIWPSVAPPWNEGGSEPALSQDSPHPTEVLPADGDLWSTSPHASLVRMEPTKYPLMYVGVVAGHWQFDSGAVCPDGLREVDITLPLAQLVVDILRWRGFQADLMGEYDVALVGYQADAFISIHADSCGVPGASGFKVARVENSSVPDQEDLLVDCLWEKYAAATGLAPHRASITADMRDYHAFRKISPYTPGAIIETGFMLDDRDLLVNRQDDIAWGIAEGIECFLEGQ
jgi:hypothetical protein